VLTSIQAVPVFTDGQMKEAKEQAAHLSDVRGATVPARGSTGNAANKKKAPDKEPEDPAPPKGKANKRKTDEPEDSL
jgi:hypothetical protein